MPSGGTGEAPIGLVLLSSGGQGSPSIPFTTWTKHPCRGGREAKTLTGCRTPTTRGKRGEKVIPLQESTAPNKGKWRGIRRGHTNALQHFCEIEIRGYGDGEKRSVNG